MTIVGSRVLSALFVCALLGAQDQPQGKPAEPARPAQQFLLRLQFQPGSTQWYRDTLERSAGTEVVGDYALHCELVREVAVGKASANGSSLTATSRRVVFREKQPDVDYDSDRGDDAQALHNKVGAVGSVVQWVCSERGVVSEHQLPATADASGPPRFYGLDGSNSLFGVLPTLPERPVAVGESWTGEVTLAAGGDRECAVPITFRLAKVERGQATIAYTVPLAEHADVMTKLGFGATSTMTGDSVLDLARGRWLRTTTTLTLAPPGAPGPLTLRCNTEAIEPPPAKATPEPAKK